MRSETENSGVRGFICLRLIFSFALISKYSKTYAIKSAGFLFITMWTDNGFRMKSAVIAKNGTNGNHSQVSTKTVSEYKAHMLAFFNRWAEFTRLFKKLHYYCPAIHH